MIEISIIDDFITSEWDNCTHGEKVISVIKKYNAHNNYLLNKFNVGLSENDIERGVKMSDKVVKALEILSTRSPHFILMCLEVEKKNKNAENIIRLINCLSLAGYIIVVAKSNHNDNYCIPFCVKDIIHVEGGTYLQNQYNVCDIGDVRFVFANSFPEFIDINGRLTFFAGTSKAAAIVMANIMNHIQYMLNLKSIGAICQSLKCEVDLYKYKPVDANIISNIPEFNLKKIIGNICSNNMISCVDMDIIGICDMLRKMVHEDE